MPKKAPLYAALLTSLTFFSVHLGAVTVNVTTLDIDAAGGLRDAINQVNSAAAGSSNTINVMVSGTYTFSGSTNLTPFTLDTGSSVTLNGNGTILDGANTYRGFIVGTGTVTINNMTLQNLKSTGGAGGASAGGGLGAGGGCFVRSGASLTLSNVTIAGTQAAVGGAGGNGVVNTVGGGGGMGGAGGSNTTTNVTGGPGGGGLFGNGGNGASNSGGGGGGGMFGNGGTSVGSGYPQRVGGGGGGGRSINTTFNGGTAADNSFGGTGGAGPSGSGGGTGGTSGASENGAAGSSTLGGGGGGGGYSIGNGGAGSTSRFGGGGGGAASQGTGGAGGNWGGGGGGLTSGAGVGGYGGGGAGSAATSTGALGGFGGGGGSGDAAGGNGGFGGGGGGSIATGSTPGTGGTFGGNGGGVSATSSAGGGGGGAALGGTVFVDSGASFTIGDGVTIASAGTLTAGAGGTAAGTATAGTAGSTFGQDMFLRDTGTFHYNSPAGNNLSLTNLSNGSTTSSSGGIILDSTNTGTLTLAGTGGTAPTYGGPITINGGKLSLTSAGSDLSSLTGPVTTGTGGTLAFNLTSSGTFSNGITGTGGISQTGGTVVLTLGGTNTYSGQTTVTSGTIRALGANTFSANSVQNIASGATLDLNGLAESVGGLTGAGNVTLGANGALTLNSSTSNTYSGVISGSGTSSLTLTGTGTQILTGGSTYTGSTTISGGTLQVGTNNALPNVATSIASGATLNIQAGLTQTLTSISGTGTITGGSILSILSASGSGTISPNLSGTVQLTKTGGGTTIITGTNTHAAQTSVNSGTLQCGGANVLSSSSTVSVSSGAGVTLDLNSFPQTIQGLNGGGGGGGNVTLGNNGSLTVGNNNQSVNFSGIISGTGTSSLTKIGTGAAQFGGLNTYTGATILSGGSTRLVTNNNVFPTTTALSISSGATFDLNNFSQTVANLDGAGAVVLGTGTLTVNNTTASTLSGPISGGGNIVKQGGGDLTLSGTNTYSGSTTVSAGRLIGTTSSLPTSIANSGIVRFEQTTSGTYAGVISGGGAFQKAGSGMVTLTSASTYSGITTISAGTVQVGVNNALPNVSTSVSLGATLDIQAGFTQTLSSIAGTGAVTTGTGSILALSGAGSVSASISGTGGVTKSAAGTMVLNNTNTYSGTTTISAGTLQSGDVNTLSNGSIHSITSGATLDLNSLAQTIAGLSGAGNVTMGASGALTLNNSTNSSFSGVISGTGTSSLTKTGTGTQTLSGVSTYSGATTISTGTLQVGINNALPNTALSVSSGSTLDINGFSQTLPSVDGAGAVTLGSGTLTINNASTTSVSAVISGASGNVTKQGAGDLTLSGANTYTGATTISAGRLIGTTSSLPGAITNNSILRFDQSTIGTFGSTITGTGALEKTGTGTVTLAGATTLSGAISVTQGLLNFNNTVTAGGVSVASGAAIGGTGTLISSITVNGTLAPGSSIGTMTVNGDVTFTSSAIFEEEFNATSADLLQSTGTVTLGNATLNLDPLGSGFAPSQTYTIITATTGVVGTFGSVVGIEDLPRYSAQVRYLANSVLLDINLIPFSALVTSGNASAAAAGFSSIPLSTGNAAEIEAFLSSANTAQLYCDFDQMQSSTFNAVPIIQEATTVAVRSAFTDRLDQIHGNDCFKDMWENTRGLWATPLGNFSKQKGRPQGDTCNQSKLGFHSNTYGASMGIDGDVNDYIVLGAALSFAHTSLTWSQDQAKSRTNSGFATFYGTIFNDLLYTDFGLTGAYNSVEARRNIFLQNGIGTLQQTARHHNHSSELDAYWAGGVTVNFTNIQVKPFVALEYIFIHENSYGESGAESLDLKVYNKNSNLLREQIGATASFCQKRKDLSWSEEIGVSYIHEDRFRGKHTYERFVQGTDEFTVSGFLPNRNLVAPVASLTAIFLEDYSLTASYAGEFGKKWKTQTGRVEFLYKF